MSQVPDDHFALLVQGRLKFDAGKAMTGDAVH